MEDQPAGSGDLTTGTEANPAEPRRRRGWLRRRSKKAAAESDPRPADGETSPGAAPIADVADEDAALAPRTPVGKRGKRATATPAENGDAQVTSDESPKAEADPAPAAAQTAEPVETDESSETDQSEAAVEGDESGEPVESPVLVPHRSAGRRLTVAAAAAAVLFVAAGGFAGAAVQPYLTDRALVHNKIDVARTAAEAITTLWTYTPEDMETLPDRSARYLAGDFATEYRRYIDAIAPTNKQAQVTNSTEVMGTAVESISPTEATAIVYTNSVSMSPVSKNIPSLRYLSYRLTLERDDADWLINRMSTVTQLDLTPQM